MPREAVGLNANGFLVKPLDQRKLFPLLEKIAKERKAAALKDHQTREIRNRLRKSLPIMEEALVYNLLFIRNWPSEQQLTVWKEILGIKNLPNVALIFKFNSPHVQDELVQEKKRQDVLKNLRRRMAETDADVLIARLGWERLVVLAVCPHQEDYKARLWSLEFAVSLKEIIAKDYSPGVRVGVGSVVPEPGLIWSSFEEAQAAAEVKQQAEDGFPVHWGDYSETRSLRRVYILDAVKKVVMSIRLDDLKQAERDVLELVGRLNKAGCKGEHLKDSLYEFFVLLVKDLSQENGNLQKILAIKGEILQKLKSDTSEKANGLIIKVVRRLAEENIKARQVHNENLINNIKKFIMEHAHYLCFYPSGSSGVV